jgi:hypothetical protein
MAFVAIVLGIGGFAFASIPDRRGVIHACYKKKNGKLRVVSSRRKCGSRERSIAWNRRGRRGARGLTGARGSRGRRGRRGATGPTGPAGKDGSALAYAEVNGTAPTGGDTVDGARSKNVSDAQVTHPAAGVYCFYLSFTPSNVVATADWASGGTAAVATSSLSDSGSCTGAESASVRLRDVEAAADKDASFFVTFN